MFNHRLLPVSLGILVLSTMFLMGQETWPPAACVDKDGDGYGSPASATCTYPQLDCNDNDVAINPGVSESSYGDPICSDGSDNDCDGLVDSTDPGCQQCALPEECDDGNTVSGDGCSSDCRIEGSACSDFPCGRRGSKVELCHVPPGNERQKHTLCIAPSAVPAHLTHHPDYCGPCDFHDSGRGEDDSRRGKKKDDSRKGRGR